MICLAMFPNIRSDTVFGSNAKHYAMTFNIESASSIDEFMCDNLLGIVANKMN